MRGELTFADGSCLHFRELVEIQARVIRIMYSYHCQREDGSLIFRYDDTPHFPTLPQFPHHKHIGSQAEVFDPSHPILLPFYARSRPCIRFRMPHKVDSIPPTVQFPSLFSRRGNLSLLTAFRRCDRVQFRQPRSLTHHGHDAAFPELLERAFHPSPRSPRQIFSVGAAFHRLNLAKKTERAESKVCEPEARYHTTLAQLEAEGLPEDADYRMHEDYIEWHYWMGLEQSQKALSTLSALLPAAEPPDAGGFWRSMPPMPNSSSASFRCKSRTSI